MLTAYYDLACNLPSYDVVTFLMAAEHERIKRGEDAIDIEIIPGVHEGFRPGNLWPFTTEQRRAMRARVVAPMCTLLPSCRRVTVREIRPSPEPNSFGFGEVTLRLQRFLSAYAEGIRPLRPRSGQEPGRLITLTLREAEHWPARNSRVVEWKKAALSLQQMGHRVVVVRDTAKADEDFGGDLINTDPVASRNLEARARLYRSAACNVFVSNGPAWFALALDAPTLMFRPTCEGAGSLARPAALAAAGLPQGAQLPNAPMHHRLVWHDDTAEAITAAVFAFTDKRKPN